MCIQFVKKRLPSDIDRNASCPFQEVICRHEKGNINLDTGYLNSQVDLGVNGPVDYQFNFRIITQCAPLAAEKYQKIVNYSQDKSYMRYFLGAQTLRGSEITKRPNYTYEAELPSSREQDWLEDSSPSADYSIR